MNNTVSNINSTKIVFILSVIAFFLAGFVICLGAYTRLTDAGLGCPDWPGCYGYMVVPSTIDDRLGPHVLLPNEQRQAWTEMIHRYIAGSLALFIVSIAGYSLVNRASAKKTFIALKLPCFLLFLVIFQAALGMWTVTLKLLPVVVMAHLLGGMLIFAGLGRLALQSSAIKPCQDIRWKWWVRLGIMIVLIQIALGGWVSANYAGIACIGFPQCNGQWLPSLHFANGFNLFSSVGANYQGGLLEAKARVTIQFIHRMGAILTVLYSTAFALWVIKKSRDPHTRYLAMSILFLVLLQFSLGVSNVIYLLPLPIAVAHNGVAGLLLTSFVLLAYLVNGRSSHTKRSSLCR